MTEGEQEPIFKPMVLSSKPVEEAMTPFPETWLSWQSL
jgi:hypothetical protein